MPYSKKNFLSIFFLKNVFNLLVVEHLACLCNVSYEQNHWVMAIPVFSYFLDRVLTRVLARVLTRVLARVLARILTRAIVYLPKYIQYRGYLFIKPGFEPGLEPGLELGLEPGLDSGFELEMTSGDFDG